MRFLVEPRGFEPLTSAVRLQRSPNPSPSAPPKRSLVPNLLRRVRPLDKATQARAQELISRSHCDTSVTSGGVVARSTLAPKQRGPSGPTRGAPGGMGVPSYSTIRPSKILGKIPPSGKGIERYCLKWRDPTDIKRGYYHL